MAPCIRVSIDPERPEPALLAGAAVWILNGGIVAVPTDTLYGLAADPFDAVAVARLFAVKGRSAERALPLVAADSTQVEHWLGELPVLGRQLATRFWPGPLTLLVRAPAALVPEVTGGTGLVGVRVPAHAVARGLCVACRKPLTATSANISGRSPTDDPVMVVAALGPQIDVLLDAGRTPGAAPSTIVDVTGDEPRLVRAGAIPWDVVQMAARRE
jgi:L-threonylcarbamoyladenylate synthase